LTLTSLVISLIVHAVVTGLIVFKILKVYWTVRHTFHPEDRTLGVGGTNAKLRFIIFVIIESDMAMFTVQLIRVVLTILDLDTVYLIIGMHQMFDVIIGLVVSIFHFTEIILGNNTHHHPRASVNGIVLP
jgi:hypothetical protein